MLLLAAVEGRQRRRRHERVVDRLVEAGRFERCARELEHAVTTCIEERLGLPGARGERGLDAVVADEAQDLLDEIDLARQVGPERGHAEAHRIALTPLDLEAEREQQLAAHGLVDELRLHADDLRRALRAERHDDGCYLARVAIDDATADATAAELCEERRGAIE